MKIDTVIIENRRKGWNFGWGNGYVILPKDHPCFMLGYDKIHERWDVSIHGGLTYADFPTGNPQVPKKFRDSKEYWMIGFDTAHIYDTFSIWPKEEVQEETDRLRFRMLEIWMEKKRLETRKKENKIREMSADTIKDSVTIVTKEKKKASRKRLKKIIPLQDEGGYFTLDNYFKVDVGTYKILERNIRKGTNSMLLGPTGCGKTELVHNIANRLKLPLTIFDMGTMSDPIMSLVGTHIIKVDDGSTSSRFVPSRFSQAIQKPGVILLDEISR